MRKENQYDIIILGAGPVGALLALLLEKSSMRVAILEAQTLPEFARVHRVSAVNKRSCDILDSVGCVLAPENATPFYEVEIFEKNSPRLLNFSAAEVGETYLGKIVENHALTQTLQQAVKMRSIDFFCPIESKSIDVQEEGVRIITKDNQALCAKLVIGADGANSWLRNFLGFTFDSESYGETALVAEVTTTIPHRNIAGQFFLASGPVAFLPLHDPHKVSLVWYGTSAFIARLLDLPADIFCQALTQAWDGHLGTVTAVKDRARFELTMRHTHEYVRERVALVGDALHTIHPLAGQGLNLGIADAMCLAQTLAAAKQRRQDVGSLAVLRRYARARRAPNALMITLMKGLQQGFKLNAAPLVQGRQQAIKTFANLSLLKRATLRYAMYTF